MREKDAALADILKLIGLTLRVENAEKKLQEKNCSPDGKRRI